jgi:hypothetical protein
VYEGSAEVIEESDGRGRDRQVQQEYPKLLPAMLKGK